MPKVYKKNYRRLLLLNLFAMKIPQRYWFEAKKNWFAGINIYVKKRLERNKNQTIKQTK